MNKHKSTFPQSNCLGPILFNLYVVGLEAALHLGSLHAYDDDCQVILSYDLMQIREALQYMHKNAL